jgi:hypothetical protein
MWTFVLPSITGKLMLIGKIWDLMGVAWACGATKKGLHVTSFLDRRRVGKIEDVATPSLVTVRCESPMIVLIQNNYQLL